MRVWDVHPGYLSRSSLLGQHVEIHALLSVIGGCKKGYRSHPETLRWMGHLDKLKIKHDLTVKEMKLRGFRHNSPCAVDEESICCAGPPGYVDPPAEQFAILGRKYLERSVEGRIPLPQRGSHFWAHHKYSVMARGYRCYKEIQAFLQKKTDLFIREEGGLIGQVLAIMEKPVTAKALQNTVHHLWRYFKDTATVAENERYRDCPPDKLPLLIEDLYRMALKYHRPYLIHSTIFADRLELADQ